MHSAESLRTIADRATTSAKSLRQGNATNQMFQKIKKAPMAEMSKGGVGDKIREIGGEGGVQIP